MNEEVLLSKEKNTQQRLPGGEVNCISQHVFSMINLYFISSIILFWFSSHFSKYLRADKQNRATTPNSL